LNQVAGGIFYVTRDLGSEVNKDPKTRALEAAKKAKEAKLKDQTTESN